ncbi:hypothetical protein CANCADRAFT_43 [Tortispora caseinolytica NRRL Y-17796]|uniref:AB hydrolase-1 domain-containing protein n=1 Tax=Tortispora caseinolytica NRRL Y-17796 TaxID=767744 RepID=A0A1E4TI82_9ASCO|nr:hypothetical protein CANCADRAFT_43 [Tortispora caseinolytica NRRL Y-17796]
MLKKSGVVKGATTRTKKYATVHRDDIFDLAYNVYYSPYVAKRPSAPHLDTRLRLVLCHATGVQKEYWEPIIERWFADPAIGGIVSEIYAYDNYSHGDSGLLNRHKVGNESNWLDNSRDLVAFCHGLGLSSRNGSPLVAIGHSLGGSTCLYAAVLDPGLFTSIVAIEPVAYDGSISNPKKAKDPLRLLHYMKSSLKDEFSSREDWLNYFEKESMYAPFDLRVKSALRDTLVYQEDGKYKVKTPTWAHVQSYIGSRHSIRAIYNGLLNIGIPTLHIVGGSARWNHPDTGKAISHALGEVGELIVVPKVGHMLVAENPVETADSVKSFLVKSRKHWIDNEGCLDPATGKVSSSKDYDSLFIPDPEFFEHDTLGQKVEAHRNSIGHALDLAVKGDASHLPGPDILRQAIDLANAKAKL